MQLQVLLIEKIKHKVEAVQAEEGLKLLIVQRILSLNVKFSEDREE